MRIQRRACEGFFNLKASDISLEHAARTTLNFKK